MGYMHLYELIAFGVNCILFFVGMVVMGIMILENNYVYAIIIMGVLFLMGYTTIKMVAGWVK